VGLVGLGRRGLGGDRDPSAETLAGPFCDGGHPPPHRRYRNAGFVVTAHHLPLDDIGALPTTWAKHLGFSARDRAFVDVRGRADALTEHRPRTR
jgi:hypothetical protein